MADKSAIEWTDATWNPITGCSIVSPGCIHCYAMKLAGTRLKHIDSRMGLTRETAIGPVWTGEVRLNERWLHQPIQWKQPRRIFVCAHGDLFAENVPDAWIDKVFAIMALSPQHTFQVLTKRARRMREYLTGKHRNPQGWPAEDYDAQTCIRLSLGGLLPGKTLPNGRPDIGDFFKSGKAAHYSEADKRLFFDWPLKNVWLGVSAERQQEADQRIPELLATPAAVRFVSAEPLLGPIDFENIARQPNAYDQQMPGLATVKRFYVDALTGCEGLTYATPGRGGDMSVETNSGPALDWIIVGGESGRDARPMHPSWARSIRDSCHSADVAFFFKQWGEWRPSTPEAADGNPRSGWRCLAAHPHVPRAHELYPEAGAEFIEHLGKKAAGRLLDGVEHNAMPEPC
ncbi:phage Gp37/Gp68 family protein [Mesorhizobium muleiense]|uniref:phage Gp37/Gp68 family protein n=1 Tax=Mesorhizobium muleiense TaxID=1004279 RepID=UPI001F30E996|nr:phage Gp37/Gp68 family protein [Mesorhizobium muleiense]MCF6111962.1 phage Gp37/Gp68 family protein [Mesorhizobium muleiense]